MPGTRRNCGIPAQYSTHRIAQIDCALSELSDNYDFLKPRIDRRLNNVPRQKRERVVEWLTTQAYHAGRGNIAKMFGFNRGHTGAADEINNNYSSKYASFSGEDISMFLLIHNFGRNRIGRQALTYGIDSQIGLDMLEDFKIKNNLARE